ncbi:MAG: Ig-like domain repeat protein [Acidobacteriaceae bacterium]|nr:Ig-like domain repeat protein [Acidobacteriaceae bacterium]
MFIRRMLSLLTAGAALSASALAATNPHVTARPEARITKKIDNTQLVVRENSHPASVTSLPDLGRTPGNTAMSHLQLVLKSSESQEWALHSLIDAQQDKNAANFHQWMTPESFGASFGVASADVAEVKAWLQNQGFTVNSVAKSTRLIDFSGTASQVEAAFHTELHNFEVNGEVRTSNVSDYAVPSALSSVVAGPARLDNFRLSPMHTPSRVVTLGSSGKLQETGTSLLSPMFTAGSGSHYVGAADLATIFDTNPLLTSGIDGTGVSIGILGETQIMLSDVQLYRRMFNLKQNDPSFIEVGGDPGTSTSGEDGESDLDVELSGGMAPGAHVDFVTGDNGPYGGGIFTAMEYVVENNSDDIISLSYGLCEYTGASYGYNSFFEVLWEQAASQGQSVFVSSGDEGAAGCDNANSVTYARNGYNVNGMASTPYNVAVGGTMFAEGATKGATSYWSASNGPGFLTALSYIPEWPWNESTFDPYTGSGSGIWAGSSGISAYYQTPAWQTGPGVPTADPFTPPHQAVAGPHRYLPDVSLIAAGSHDGTLYCSEGSCILDDNGNVLSAGVVGGTSVAAPTMAGVQALINQKNGGRQGVPNYYYYRVAAMQNTANCSSATYLTTADATCGFHDVVSGNNNVPSNSAGTASIGFTASAGYDLATGLGSPDVTKLATIWSSVSFNATTTTLSLTPATSSHGDTYNVGVTVAPASGSGSPTGDVSIIAEATYGGVGFYTLSSSDGGVISGTLTGLPSGTYDVYAHYAGDTTYGSSNSNKVSVTVGQASTIVALETDTLSNALATARATSFTYGQNIYMNAGVGDSTSVGIPSGQITFKLTWPNGSTTSYTGALDPNGGYVGGKNYAAGAYAVAGPGVPAYNVPQAFPVLPVGSYSVVATTAGDQTFPSASSSSVAFTVGVASTTLTLTAGSTEVAPGSSTNLTATITTVSATAGGVPATGSISFKDNTLNTTIGSCTLSNGACTTSSSALAAGTHSVTAIYNGDASYGAKTSTAVTVTAGGTSSTTTLTASATSTSVGQTVTLTATVPSTSTGTTYVSFYDNGSYVTRSTVSNTTHQASYSYASLTAGSHAITAVYSGNTTLSSSTSSAVTLSVAKNVPALQLSSQRQNATGGSVTMQVILTPTPFNGVSANSYQMIPAPTGSLNFVDNGTVVATGPITYQYGYEQYLTQGVVKSLAPGTHSITAVYPGDLNYATVTSNVNTINIGLTTTAITSFPTQVGTGIGFSLSAKVTPVVANTTTISGTVKFYDGTALIGTAQVGTGGVATTSTAAVTTNGAHSITAVYSGDSNYYTSTSSAVSIASAAGNFTLTVSPNSLTIQQSHVGFATLTATTVGNWAGKVSLSCSNLPANTYCYFGSNPVSFTGASYSQVQSLEMSIATEKDAATYSGLFWIPAAFLGMVLMVGRRRFTARVQQMMVLALLLCGVLGTSGCGDNVKFSGGSAVGTSTITVNASGVGSSTANGNIAATAPLTVTITKY